MLGTSWYLLSCCGRLELSSSSTSESKHTTTLCEFAFWSHCMCTHSWLRPKVRLSCASRTDYCDVRPLKPSLVATYKPRKTRGTTRLGSCEPPHWNNSAAPLKKQWKWFTWSQEWTPFLHKLTLEVFATRAVLCGFARKMLSNASLHERLKSLKTSIFRESRITVTKSSPNSSYLIGFGALQLTCSFRIVDNGSIVRGPSGQWSLLDGTSMDTVDYALLQDVLHEVNIRFTR